MALIHYPVVNKNGETIISAITNLDIHDISRAAMTYGVKSFYVVTPLLDQQELAKKIIDHWQSGFGAQYNPIRKQALSLVKIESSLDEVINSIAENEKEIPSTIVTCAKEKTKNIGYKDMRKMLENGKPHLLLFGTGWGLSEDFFNNANYVLEPIKGNTEYNHLSVRSAAAIIFDRLMF
ncbi:MAG: RNA methyltransferase [Desulfobacterales bacterium]|nr:RNA methyltransferase [Desulfobacterales bacterium]